LPEFEVLLSQVDAKMGQGGYTQLGYRKNSQANFQ